MNGQFTDYTVRGEVFPDVRLLNVPAEASTTTVVEYDTEYYWAPMVGVVKKVVHDTANGTQTWELISYDLR